MIHNRWIKSNLVWNSQA